MALKKLLWLLFGFVGIQILFAVSCGDIISTQTVLNQDLICNGSGLELTTGDLNCNGFSIIGNGTGTGVMISGYNYRTIENCDIENFQNAIALSSKYAYVGNGWGGGNYMTYYPYEITIKNNLIKNNQIGIITSDSISENVFDNEFINNSDYGIHMTSSNAKVWNNSFEKTGIYYTRTKGNSFCQSNFSNFYYGGAIGPDCNCIIPYDNLEVNSNSIFCFGNYHLPTGIKLTKGGSVDCNNSTLMGDKIGVGISVLGVQNGFIKNCEITNYDIGINLNVVQGFDGYVYFPKEPTYNNYFENLKISEVNVAVLMQNDARAENIHNSILISKQYNIYNSISRTINATDNFWGTTNETEIEYKLLNKNNVIYKPFINDTNIDYMLNESSIKFKIENSKNYLYFNIDKVGYFDFDLDVEMYVLRNGTILKSFNLKNISITNKQIEFEFEESLQNNDLIYIIADPENIILEQNEYNNFARAYFEEPKKYTIISDIKSEVLNEEIKLFLADKLENYSYVNNYEDAEILIYINNLNPNELFISDNLIELNNKPYEAKILSYRSENLNQIIKISGNDIEGVLAAVKFFSKNVKSFENNNITFEINDSSIDAISIYDYLHKNENILYYKTETKYFQNEIRDILYGKKYEFEEILIPVINEENISNYRLWRLNSKNSNKFKNFVDKDKIPIVLAGGLWSDITTWEFFGRELANNGLEVYLIELTGNENIECDLCYNYNYTFLTNSVYPMYVNTILNLSNSSKIKYVGHSNGARVALDSISTGNQNQSQIDTLILVGVPGAFEGNTILKETSIDMQKIIDKNIENKNHVSMTDLLVFWKSNTDASKISSNLWKQYYYWMNSTDDLEPGENFSIGKFTLISGNFTGFSDGIVTIEDEREIFQNILSEDKFYYESSHYHIGMSEKKDILEIIKLRLN